MEVGEVWDNGLSGWGVWSCFCMCSVYVLNLRVRFDVSSLLAFSMSCRIVIEQQISAEEHASTPLLVGCFRSVHIESAKAVRGYTFCLRDLLDRFDSGASFSTTTQPHHQK
jgi:hypothetical protein